MSKLTFTMNQLMANDPCEDGLDRLTKSLGTYIGPTVVHLVDHSDHLTTGDILWGLQLTTLSELEQRMICTKVAILAARSVIRIYENEYPDDQRPRRAIEAAEECVRCEFSAESVERARQAESEARLAAAAAAAAAARLRLRLAARLRLRLAAEWAILASDNPDALRAETKSYLLELLRGYDE